MVYTYNGHYYSAIKRDETLIHAITWKTLKNITPSEKKQRSRVVWFHLYEISKIGKSIEMESRLAVAMG